jgi:hypothetical protein
MSVTCGLELTQDQASNLRMLGCGIALIRGGFPGWLRIEVKCTPK